MSKHLEALAAKLKTSLARRGLWGTTRYVGVGLLHKFWDLTPPGRAARRRREAAERAFDRAYHVDTAGIVRLADLDIASPNWRLGVYYEPIDPAIFREMLAAAGLDCPRFTFIDFGAGKGRGLVLAAEYPFRKIIGVEFAPRLVEIARRNLARCRLPRQECRDVEVVLADAARFPLPDGPLALLFNNPFDEPVMAAVIDNLRRSLAAQPRPATVFYYYPYLDRLWSAVPGLRRISAAPKYVIYSIP